MPRFDDQGRLDALPRLLASTPLLALAALIVASSVNAQTAAPTIITLSCDGKVVDARASDPKPEPISKMGLVVNLPDQSVAGFGGIVAHIDRTDAAGISFSGTGPLGVPSAKGGQVGTITVMGELDRVTGAVSATTLTTATTFSWELLCKPTKRLF